MVRDRLLLGLLKAPGRGNLSSLLPPCQSRKTKQPPTCPYLPRCGGAIRTAPCLGPEMGWAWGEGFVQLVSGWCKVGITKAPFCC